MGKISNPEFTGEKLRALVEFIVPNRQRVVSDAVYYVEKAVDDFTIEQKPAQDIVATNTTVSTPERVKFVEKAPQTMKVFPAAENKKPRRNATVPKPVTSSLDVSTARANLSAIFSSIEGAKK